MLRRHKAERRCLPFYHKCLPFWRDPTACDKGAAKASRGGRGGRSCLTMHHEFDGSIGAVGGRSRRAHRAGHPIFGSQMGRHGMEAGRSTNARTTCEASTQGGVNVSSSGGAASGKGGHWGRPSEGGNGADHPIRPRCLLFGPVARGRQNAVSAWSASTQQYGQTRAWESSWRIRRP